MAAGRPAPSAIRRNPGQAPASEGRHRRAKALAAEAAWRAGGGRGILRGAPPPHLLLVALLTAAAWGEDGSAGDLAGLPPVPNPYGFDLRLALRTHLEDAFAQRDVAGMPWAGLVERYRALTTAPAPSPPPPPAPAGRAPAEDAEQARRANILLQLAREHGEHPDPGTPTDELRARLDALVQAARERATPSAPAPVAPLPVAEVPAARAPAPTATERPLDLAGLADPAAVLTGLVIEPDGAGGDRILGTCFSADLGVHFANVVRRFAAAMRRNPAARSGLLLLGHGDGVSIGVDGDHPVNLTTHLRRNVAAYHALLGVERIDCVVLLSCSRKADAQFTAFRDGLGYYPTWRASAWERTLQTLGSGLAATELALAQPPGTDLRAVVYHGDGDDAASLAETGQRTSTRYVQVDFVDGELVLTGARRR